MAHTQRWQQEFALLRELVLSCGLDETLKWGKPCYTLEGRNVVLLHGFKEYCALLFFKGALLKDGQNILVRQTENVQAARQVRFTSAADIRRQRAVLKAYVAEVIALEKSGQQVVMKKTQAFERPPELQQALAESPALRAAFEALTPGRQRGYMLHIAAAKQAKTRVSRIEKCAPRMLAGKGLND
ncbi:YdeI family protein [Hydrogenophaga sp.]|uniref:YdeI/OmpD-associated family protein n=1 Tax=Hydrogenophaga sp. TaxID=1904254 RepID=UPI003569EFC4